MIYGYTVLLNARRAVRVKHVKSNAHKVHKSDFWKVMSLPFRLMDDGDSLRPFVFPTPRYKLSESALPLLPLDELLERDEPLLERELDDE